MSYYNRYKDFQQNESLPIIPYVEIDDKDSDFTIKWEEGSRLDKISQDYYGHPYGSIMIELKNSSKGFDQFEWAIGEQIIIPFPWEDTIQQYREKVQQIKNLETIE